MKLLYLYVIPHHHNVILGVIVIIIVLQHNYSLIISDSNVDDACQTLELFLESYWAFTRSVILVDSLNLTSRTSIATATASASRRPTLPAQTTIDATVTS